jgi:hypothetical protein
MKVNELIKKLEECDSEKEVYYVGVGGDWEKIRDIDEDVNHEQLSIVPYKEENFVGLR